MSRWVNLTDSGGINGYTDRVLQGASYQMAEGKIQSSASVCKSAQLIADNLFLSMSAPDISESLKHVQDGLPLVNEDMTKS